MTVLTSSSASAEATADRSEDLCIYECTILLPTTLSEKEEGQTLAAIEQLCTEKGGKILHKDFWGRHGLAYPIRKHREGKYVVYVVELPPGAVPALGAQMRLEKSVLRHLLVKTPEHYEITSFAARAERWKKEQEQHAEVRERQREEELKQKIVHRAARAAPVQEAPKVPTAPPEESVSLEEKLTEIISDEDLKL